MKRMDIRGLVLINSASVDAEYDSFSLVPAGLIDVAGRNALDRVVERMTRYGLTTVTAVIEATAHRNVRPTNASREGLNCVTAPADRFWRAAESAFNDLAQDGAELVLLVRVGSYAEVDFDRLVQFHLDAHARVSQVTHMGRPLETFCISASRRNDAASLFRSQLVKCRSECPQFEHSGYFNSLSDAYDVRQFAVDILTLRTETAPAGDQIRPGVWAAKESRIEKGARVLAPAYVGTYARIRSGAVITRCSSIERHAQVDCGTVVENSSVLPYCYVGAGLELAHSVAGFGQIANLRRACTAPILDEKLLRHIAVTSGNQLLASAAELVTHVPKQFWRGMFGPPAVRQGDLKTALHQTSPVLGKTSGYRAPACSAEVADEFPPNLAVARTHGNQ